MPESKLLDVKEFREFGYLQELNRRFLHPLGLALAVHGDDEGNETLACVWDYREDPEGIIFDEEQLDRGKSDRVFAEEHKRAPERTKALGYWIQPAK